MVSIQKNNLSKINDEVHIINIDEYESVGTHWKAWYVNAENVTYFDTFGIKHIPKENTKSIGNKNITINIHRMQAYD